MTPKVYATPTDQFLSVELIVEDYLVISSYIVNNPNFKKLSFTIVSNNCCIRAFAGIKLYKAFIPAHTKVRLWSLLADINVERLWIYTRN